MTTPGPTTPGPTAPGPTAPGPPGTGPGRFARDSAVMAVGTALSRVTGVLRLLALVYAVHFQGLADSYNLANTMPNVIHDVVLGGIVGATFVPVFVSRLAGRAEDEAWDAISAVASVTVIAIAVASIAFLVASPFIIDLMTAFNHSAQAGVERTVATQLLVLFVPQLACYGCVSLGGALLNARRSFAAPMFTPIVNNLVLVVVLFAFGTIVRNPTLGGVYAHRGQLYLLGLGTTAGVVAQTLLLLPSLRRAGVRLHWYPRLRHEAVRAVIGLSGWTFGLVLANQVALIVVLALSVHVGQGAVSAYTYAYTFFQLPYGVVAVSIMSAAAPELAARWTRGDLPAFRRRMDNGLRAIVVVILPSAAFMAILARPLLSLLGHMIGHPGSTGPTAVALAMLAVGLPGFCVFLYVVRVLQTMQDLRSAFWLYVLENGVNIVLALLLAGPLGVRGIALSISIAYTVAAVAGLRHLRAKVGGLGGARLTRPILRVAGATAVLVAGTVIGTSVSGSESAFGLIGRIVLGTVVGVGGFVLAAGIMAQLHRPRPSHASASGPASGPASVPTSVPGAASHRAAGGARHRRRRGSPPPPPPALPPAGRPPLRPHRLGPTRKPGTGDGDRGRLDE
ncbi:MAG: murein biosynthesis integral membrane protein MurJ [Acidimicrobiales bacterium]